jgi:P-type conjugative transfer protein TrbJ
MAQFAVLDAGNLVQNTTTALSMLKQVQTSAQQLIAEYNLVRNTITQIENQVKNLQRIPKGLSYIDDISLFGSRLSGLMATANGISFQLDQATRQFEHLYQQTATLTAPNVFNLRQQMIQSRMETAGIAIQVQSVRTNLSDIYSRLCNLLSGSYGASGNLDSLQIAAQQQALLIHSQQIALTMQATQARMETQRQAEEMALQQMALAHYKQVTTLAPVGDWQAGPQLEMRVRGSLQ